jgi:hypothetical protein
VSASVASRAPPRFKLTPPDLAESELHIAVATTLDVLLLPPTMWTTFPSGGYELSPAAASRLYRLGMKRGVPDVLIVHEGRLHCIELKTATGRLSKSRMVRTRSGGARHVTGQVEMHGKLTAAGARVAVARSVDDVLMALAAWGIPTRNHHSPIEPIGRHPGGST